GRALAHAVQPALQLGTVRVRTVPVDDLDVRPQRYLVAEDLDHVPAFDDASPERVFGHEADYEYRVPRLVRVVLEVMHYPAAFRHPAGRDDDHGSLRRVQRLGF